MSSPTPGGEGAAVQLAGRHGFTTGLCHRHRVWAVDATERDELPEGWRTLAEELFDKIATVMAQRPATMLVVRGLREEAGGLAPDIHLVADTPAALWAIPHVQRLIEGARRASERTCSVCGGPGRVRSALNAHSTRCDAHAGEPETGQPTPAHLGEIGAAGLGSWGASERAATPTEAPAPGGGWDHALYDVADVGAALGHRRWGRGASPPGSVYLGDPEELPTREVDTDQQAFLRRLLDAGEAGGWRALTVPEPASLAGLDALHARAPHMAEVTALVRRHLRAAIAMGLPTSLPALMLLGEPGTGKTWFLQRLAAVLGLPFRRYSMSGQSLADGLVGANPTWRNAQSGLVAKTLLGERVANPLVLVDEFDKARSHQMEDPYRGFYDLLEPEGARTFTDEYLGFPMDASRVSWVLAGNDIAPLPAPIVDRLTVVIVPAPDEAHLRAVAASIYADCNEVRRRFFPPTLDEAVADRLLETNPRGIRTAVSEAMTRAASDGRRALRADDVVVPASPRRPIGFR